MYTHSQLFQCIENYYRVKVAGLWHPLDRIHLVQHSWVISDLRRRAEGQSAASWEGGKTWIRREALEMQAVRGEKKEEKKEKKPTPGNWVVVKELTTIKNVLAQLRPGGRLVGNCLLFQQIWAVCRYLNTKWFQFAAWGGGTYHRGGQHTQWKLERVIWWKSLNVPLPAR